MNIAIFQQIWAAFNEDKATRLAAAIAYSTIFSIAPLFIVLTAIIGYVLGLQNGGHGHHIAESALLSQIEQHVGKNSADAVRDMISTSFNKPRQNIIAEIVGWLAFLFGASALFSSLQDALNSIWHIEATQGGWKQMLRDRLASFGMLAVMGFLLLASTVGTIFVSSFGTVMLSRMPFFNNPVLVATFTQVFTAVVVMLVFSAMYKFLPSVRIAWSDVLSGAFVTTLLFIFGEALVATYLHIAGSTSSYGASGSILVALLWIYYTAIIFLLGAEYTKIHAKRAITSVETKVRTLTDQPAGIDPRSTSTNAQCI